MRFRWLYEVHIGTRVHIHHSSGLVGGQQQAVVAALVGQSGEELRLRQTVPVLGRGTLRR